MGAVFRDGGFLNRRHETRVPARIGRKGAAAGPAGVGHIATASSGPENPTLGTTLNPGQYG